MSWYDDEAAYYRAVDETVALTQGDIVIAPTSIILPNTAESDIAAPTDVGQERHVTLWHGRAQSLREAMSLSANVRWGMAMVMPHSCALEKEWNERVTQLLGEGKSQDEAEAIANDDADLDPYVVLAPLLTYDTLPQQKHQSVRTAGRLGTYPVCSTQRIPATYVDFTRLSTVHHSLVPVDHRIAALSDVALGYLQHAIATYFAMRSKSRLNDLTAAIGQKILDIVPVDAPKGRLRVSILLEDGSKLILEGDSRPAAEGAPAERAPRRKIS